MHAAGRFCEFRTAWLWGILRGCELSLTRRCVLQVVIAKIQDITVREWLPLFGISESELRSMIANDRTTAPAATADLTVEFSTAAYRFGHDLVPDKLGPHPTVELFDGNKFFGIQKTGA